MEGLKRGDVSLILDDCPKVKKVGHLKFVRKILFGGMRRGSDKRTIRRSARVNHSELMSLLGELEKDYILLSHITKTI